MYRCKGIGNLSEDDQFADTLIKVTVLAGLNLSLSDKYAIKIDAGSKGIAKTIGSIPVLLAGMNTGLYGTQVVGREFAHEAPCIGKDLDAVIEYGLIAPECKYKTGLPAKGVGIVPAFCDLSLGEYLEGKRLGL